MLRLRVAPDIGVGQLRRTATEAPRSATTIAPSGLDPQQLHVPAGSTALLVAVVPSLPCAQRN